MVQRYAYSEEWGCVHYDDNGDLVCYEDYQKLEAENARLRQQRDAANAQLDFILENTKCDTATGQ